MADTDDKAIADFYAGLSDDDRAACAMDVLLYGSAFVQMGADGVKRRVDGAAVLPMPRKFVSRDELLKLFGEDDG